MTDSLQDLVADIEEHAKILAANGRDPSALDGFADRLRALSTGAVSRAAREAMGACPCGASMCDGVHEEGPTLIELLAEMDRFACEWEECTVEDVEHFANKLRAAIGRRSYRLSALAAPEISDQQVSNALESWFQTGRRDYPAEWQKPEYLMRMRGAITAALSPGRSGEVAGE